MPGTGPFRSVKRVEQEIWVMQKNPDYWMEGLPYLDGIEFYHGLPFSPELGSAFLSGRTDYARLIDPVTRKEADGRNDMTATDYYQSVIQAVWVNADPRAVQRPARAPRHAPRLRPAGAGRCRQGCRADDGRRLHLSVLGCGDAEGRPH